MMNYNEINDFIIKVFNYYNGKINVINKAVLDINTCNLMTSEVGGCSILPNVVSINPMVICRYHGYDEFYIKSSIVETVIHELYHTDQIINYQLYMADINYNKFIEHACQLQTVIYMAGHTQEIYDEFGIDVSINKYLYNKLIGIWHKPGVYYQRRHFYDHVFMCVDNICDFTKEDGELIHQAIIDATSKGKSVTIDINGDIIPAYVDGEPVSIEEFNNRFSKYIKFTAVWNINYDITCEGNGNIIMNINMSNFMDIMCTKVV